MRLTPIIYPRDINGYQTGSAQYDSNGVPIYNGQRPNNGSTPNHPMDRRVMAPNSTQNSNQNRIKLRRQNNDPNCIPNGSTNPQQNQFGQYTGSRSQPLKHLPERPTLHQPGQQISGR